MDRFDRFPEASDFELPSTSTAPSPRLSPEKKKKKRITQPQDVRIMSYLKDPLEKGKINEDELFVFLSEFNKLKAIERHEDRMIKRLLHGISKLRKSDEDVSKELRRTIQETSMSERTIHELQIEIDKKEDVIQSLSETIFSNNRATTQLREIRDRERKKVQLWENKEKEVRLNELKDLKAEKETLERSEVKKVQEICEVENRIQKLDQEIRTVLETELRKRKLQFLRLTEEFSFLSEKPGQLEKEVRYFESKIRRLMGTMTTKKRTLSGIEKANEKLEKQVTVDCKEKKYKLKTEIGNFESLILKCKEKIRMIVDQIGGVLEHQAFIRARTEVRKKETVEITLMKEEANQVWKDAKRRDFQLRFKLEHLRKRVGFLKNVCDKMETDVDDLMMEKKQLIDSFKKQKKKLDQIEDVICLQVQKYLETQSKANRTAKVIRLKRKSLAELGDRVESIKKTEIEMKNKISELSDRRDLTTHQIQISKQKFVDGVSKVKTEIQKISDLKKRLKKFTNRHHDRENFLQRTTKQKMKYQRILQETELYIRMGNEEKRILKYENRIQGRRVFEKERMRLQLRKQFDVSFRNNETLKQTQAELERRLEVLKDKIFDTQTQVNLTEGEVQKNESTILSIQNGMEESRIQKNMVGREVIEQNDMILILTEKLKVQKRILADAEIHLVNKRKELESVKIQLRDLENQDLVSAMKHYHTHLNLKDQVSELTNEDEALDAQIEDVKKIMEDPRNPLCGEIRFIKRTISSDQTYSSKENLRSQISKLRNKCQKKKEYLMERHIILNEITKTSDKLRRTSIDWRNYVLTNTNLTVGLNLILSKIRNQDRKMKSLLSEISIHEANLMTLKIQNKEIQDYYSKISKFSYSVEDRHQIVPLLEEEEEEEKAKMKKKKKKKVPKELVEKFREMKMKKREEDENEKKRAKRKRCRKEKGKRVGDLKTTALVRPNCYIPDNIGSLGLPVPYLSFCPPVMPIKTGSSMRFIKKPKKRSINVK